MDFHVAAHESFLPKAQKCRGSFDTAKDCIVMIVIVGKQPRRLALGSLGGALEAMCTASLSLLDGDKEGRV